MRRALVLVILACLLATGTAEAIRASASALRGHAADAGPARLLVGFDGESPPRGHEFAGGRVLAAHEGARIAIVEVANVAAAKAHALRDPAVRYVEVDRPDYGRLLFAPNDARYAEAGHWGSKKIGAEAAWDRTLGSTSVKVGMIDSGINRGHEEYAGQSRVLQGHDFVNGDADPNDESGCNWHGTHTTGTAGATIHNGKGIAGMSQHTILPVKAFSNTRWGCTGSTSALVSAVQYVADQGAHISSNSWGGGTSSAMRDAIQYAHAKGVIHVAASGNGGCKPCVSEPWTSNADAVIIVASTTSTDGLSSFSSGGPEVDVAAPGSSILSTTGGTSGYATMSGTSMAAPHVSGTAALLLALEPSWGFAEVDARLKSSAVDLGPAGKDDGFGHGRIDAGAATAGLGGGSGSGGGGNTPPPGADPPPTPPAESTVYAENFDDGSAQGWRKSASRDLWHIEDGCVDDHSARYKLAWTRGGACDYDTGGRVANWVQTGGIDLRGKTDATLRFHHRFDIEQFPDGAYDRLMVQASADGNAWTTLRQWDSRGPNVTSWTAVALDVTAYAGGTLHVRFATDTVDGVSNDHAGWYVDDVEVTAR